jgi:hypothetical protein
MNEKDFCNAPSGAMEFLGDSTLLVELPSLGKRVRIRKVTGIDLLSTGSVMRMPVRQMRELYTSGGEDQPAGEASAMYETLIMRGVVEPVVVNKPWSEVNWEGGEVHISVFGGDLMWLAGQIMKFSGIGKEEGERARPFSRGGLGGNPPHGESLREAADRDPAAFGGGAGT